MWFGFVTAWSSAGIDFDLACYYGLLPYNGSYEEREIGNSNTALRHLTFSDDAIGYGIGYSELPPLSIDELIANRSPMGEPSTDHPVPAIVFINEGVVTEISMIFWS